MASIHFKKEINKRTRELFKALLDKGLARNNTGIAKLMIQPLQVISKLFSGERIITMEQCSMLAKNANVNADWVVTGRGKMFIKKISSFGTEQANLKRLVAAYQQEVAEDPIERLQNTIHQIRKEMESLKNFLITKKPNKNTD